MQMNESAPSEEQGLAPSATPAVVYGVLAVSLAAIPLVGFLLGWLAFFRSQQALIQLNNDSRLVGRGLRRAGVILGIIGLVLGAASTVIWIVVLASSMSGR